MPRIQQNPLDPVVPRHPASRRGVALLLVLFAMAFTVVTTAGFMSSQRVSTAVASQSADHASARGVAESGLELTLAYLNSSETWRSDESQGVWASAVSFGGGTFTVTVTEADGDFTDDATDPISVTVVATVDGISHTVGAQVRAGVSQEPVRVLVVTGNDPPSGDDPDKITMLEGMGYTVTTIEDSDSSSNYSTAMADVDVIYISEESSSSSVNASVFTSSLGVVSDERYVDDRLGISTSDGSNYSGTTIDITDNTHAITEELSLGNLVVASSTAEFTRRNSTIASGAQILAERSSSSNAALVVLEAGATDATGSPAAGRRVALPFGDSGFDVDDLNATGQQLIQRSIDWAAGRTGTSVTNGLNTNWYNESSNPSGLADIDWADVADTSVESQINWSSTGSAWRSGINNNRFAVQLTGYLTVPTDGAWTFYLESNDGSELVLDGNTVIDNDGNRSSMTEVSGGLTLSADTPVAIRVRFYERTGQAGLILRWEGPSTSKQVIPASAFTTTDPGGSSGSGAEVNADAQLIALYEFNNGSNGTAPTLIGQWQFEETISAGGGSGGDYGLGAQNRLTLNSGSRIDGYDSSAGNYSSTNGYTAVVSTNSTSNGRISGSGQIRGDAFAGAGASNPNNVITVSVTGSESAQSTNVDFTNTPDPTGMPGSSGDHSIDGSNQTLNNVDRTYSKLEIKGGARLRIRGDVRILVTGEFLMDDGSEVTLDPGATLAIYVQDKVTIKGGSEFNYDTTRSADAAIYMMDSGEVFSMDDASRAVGRFVIRGTTEIKGNSQVYGVLRGRGNVSFQDSSDMHVDTSLITGGGGGGASATDATATTDGTYEGGAFTNSSGYSGNAAEFDGSDDYIEIPHDSSHLLDTGSLSFWFRADDTNGQQGLIGKDSSDYDDGGHISVWLDGQNVHYRIQSNSSSYTMTYQPVSANTWNHVVVTWGAGGARLYVNGTQRDSDSYTGGLGTSSGGSGNLNPWAIGASNDDSGNNTNDNLRWFYDGRIDDVRLYNQNLEADQITNLYSGTNPGGGTTDTVTDTSGFGTALDLTIDDVDNVTWVSDGLQINSPVEITSAAAATKLRDALMASDEYTIVCSFTPSTLAAGDQDLYAFEGSSSADWIELESDGDDFTLKSRSSSGSSSYAVNNVLTLSEQQVTFSYDGENLVYYHNGVRGQSWAKTGNLDGIPSDVKLLLAVDRGAANENFVGTLHRVEIYDRGLDDTGVQQVFNGQPPTYTEEAVTFEATWIETD